MSPLKNIFRIVCMFTVLLLFVWDMQLAPSKAEAQACVDAELVSCDRIWGPIVDFFDVIFNNEAFHCPCPNGYVAVTTSLASGCGTLLINDWDYLLGIPTTCFFAKSITLCVGS